MTLAQSVDQCVSAPTQECLLAMPDWQLAERLTDINDLGIFSKSKALTAKLTAAFIIRFGMNSDFTFGFDGVTSGVSLQPSGYLNNNGQSLLMPDFQNFTGINVTGSQMPAQLINGSPGGMAYGFFIAGQSGSGTILQEPMFIKAEGDSILVRDDIYVHFFERGGSLNITRSAEGSSSFNIHFHNAYITVIDDELYGSGNATLRQYSSGFGGMTILDRTNPVLLFGNWSWACVDKKDRCARPGESASNLTFWILTNESNADELLNATANGSISGFVLWTLKPDQKGDPCPAAIAAGDFIATFGRDGPLVQSLNSSMRWDYFRWNPDSEKPLHDLIFWWSADTDPGRDLLLGRVISNSYGLELRSTYDGSRFDGIYAEKATNPYVDAQFNTLSFFNPAHLFGFEVQQDWQSVLNDMLDTYMGEGGPSPEERSRQVTSGEKTYFFTVWDPVQVLYRDYYLLYDQFAEIYTERSSEAAPLPDEPTLVHHESFNHNSDTGVDIPVENFYLITEDKIIIQQREIDQAGIFDMYSSLKMMQQAQEDAARLCAGCGSDEKEQWIYNRLEYYRSITFVAQQIQELNGLIEYLKNNKRTGMDRIVDNLLQGPIRKWAFGGMDGAYKKLDEYNAMRRGLEQMAPYFELGANVYDLQDMAEAKGLSDMLLAIHLPSMQLLAGIQSLDEWLPTNDNIVAGDRVYDTSTVQKQLWTYLAMMAKAADDFSEMGHYDKALEYDLMLLEFTNPTDEAKLELYKSLDRISHWSIASTSEQTVPDFGYSVVFVESSGFRVPNKLADTIRSGAFDSLALVRVLNDAANSRSDEAVLRTKDFFIDLVPDTSWELALNLVPELYAAGKAGIVVKTAGGVIKWGRTAKNSMSILAKLPLMAYLGVGGGYGAFQAEDGEKYFGHILNYNGRWRLLVNGEYSDITSDFVKDVLRKHAPLYELNIDHAVQLGTKDIQLSNIILEDLGIGAAEAGKTTAIRLTDGSILVVPPSIWDHHAEQIALQGRLNAEVNSAVGWNTVEYGGQKYVYLTHYKMDPSVVLVPQITVTDEVRVEFKDILWVQSHNPNPQPGFLGNWLSHKGLTLEELLAPESYQMLQKSIPEGANPIESLEQMIMQRDPLTVSTWGSSCDVTGFTGDFDMVGIHTHPATELSDFHIYFSHGDGNSLAAKYQRYSAPSQRAYYGPRLQLVFHQDGMTVMFAHEVGSQLQFSNTLIDFGAP